MRIALGIEYDGSAYYGWQRQAEGETVQGRVEAGLSVVADHPVHVVCAGRTDTGVHATAQVVHFDTTAERTPDNWLRGVNAHLPADIRVQWATGVADGVHARFSARRRHYRYVIHVGSAPPALLRHRVCHERLPLDVAQMQTAARHLLGEHDFTSFRAVACQAKSPVKTIDAAGVVDNGDEIRFTVSARSFLHNQVRSFAGSLEYVGTGKWTVDDFRNALEAADRKACGPVAPPEGLYLVKVDY